MYVVTDTYCIYVNIIQVCIIASICYNIHYWQMHPANMERPVNESLPSVQLVNALSCMYDIVNFAKENKPLMYMLMSCCSTLGSRGHQFNWYSFLSLLSLRSTGTWHSIFFHTYLNVGPRDLSIQFMGLCADALLSGLCRVSDNDNNENSGVKYH